MRDLLARCPEAEAWVSERQAELREDQRFAEAYACMLWLDEPGPDGAPIGGADPTHLVDGINEGGWALLDNHDPGRPVGMVVAAQKFAGPIGPAFVAGIAGVYGSKAISFAELGVDIHLKAEAPRSLDSPRIGLTASLSTDPRELDDEWVAELASDAPLAIERHELSHNAGESALQLLRIGLPYIAIVWNPFVTSFATEAGKDVYAAVSAWLKRVLHRVAEQRAPVVCLESVQSGCTVRFMFRGRDVGVHIAAHDALSEAAVQAATIITTMCANEMSPVELIYEYDRAHGWSASCARLADGRAVKSNAVLVAIAKSRTGMSLGLKVL